MRQIFPHLLWLGNAGDGRDFRQQLDAGIKAVVQLAEEEPALQPPRDMMYFRCPLADGPGNDETYLLLTIVTIANLLERRIPTLVCCGGGMSRSPAVAAAALAMVYQEVPDEVLKKVAEHHPADVVPGLWNDVKTALEKERGI